MSTDKPTSSGLTEIDVGCGDHIGKACERLARAAPAFMVFNEVRVEAVPGDTPGDLEARWRAEMDRRRAEWEASPEAKRQNEEAERHNAEIERVRSEALRVLDASGVRDRYQWTPWMGEISGFGGGYEEACRNMVYAGLAWLEQQEQPEPYRGGYVPFGIDLRVATYAGVYGILDAHSDKAKELEKALTSVCPDCSGAMHQATMTACVYIARNGWARYVEEMTQRTARHG